MEQALPRNITQSLDFVPVEAVKILRERFAVVELAIEVVRSFPVPRFAVDAKRVVVIRIHG